MTIKIGLIIASATIFLLTSKNNFDKPTAKTIPVDSVKVSGVPLTFKFDTFYKKYIDADGIPVISSQKVPDSALLAARTVVIKMLSDLKINGVVRKLNHYNIRIAVMSKDEVTTDIPEHSDLNKVFPQTDWNKRGRGFGATIERPATSCAEENLLCYSVDRYKGENILVHEFAHTIHELALRFLIHNFDSDLKSVYKTAKEKGLWKNTYAISDYKEYWAEGVQCYFNANMKVLAPNGVHNEISTREQLKTYDPDLFKFISTYFNVDNSFDKCLCK